MSRLGTPLPRPQFPAPGPKVPPAGAEKKNRGFFVVVFFLSFPRAGKRLRNPGAHARTGALRLRERADRRAPARRGPSWDSNPGLPPSLQTIACLNAERRSGGYF